MDLWMPRLRCSWNALCARSIAACVGTASLGSTTTAPGSWSAPQAFKCRYGPTTQTRPSSFNVILSLSLSLSPRLSPCSSLPCCWEDGTVGRSARSRSSVVTWKWPWRGGTIEPNHAGPACTRAPHHARHTSPSHLLTTPCMRAHAQNDVGYSNHRLFMLFLTILFVLFLSYWGVIVIRLFAPPVSGAGGWRWQQN